MLTKPPDTFTAVARTIATGKPPKWLALGLEQFSDFVSSKRGSNKEYQRHRWTIERIHYSAPEAEPCYRTSETFNVPAAGGGTREITVIGCP
jgi:hypothetical protein